MKAATVGGLCSVALVVACFIDRPSESLTCSTDADCADLDGNRTCADGYCIAQDCPDDCTSCNESMHTCNVDCTTDAPCDATVTCPTGWTCIVNCTGDGACRDVVCNSDSRCSITCSGTNACNDIDCDSACRCDLTCASGACDSISCPSRGNGANQVECTTDGSTSAPCDSSHATGCASC